jgi:type IV pilus assembly protein PilO
MAFADSLQSLKEIDLSDLDVENIGTWPLAVKAFVWTLALGLIGAGGYFGMIQGQQEVLVAEQAREADLRGLYERRAREAANLEAYRSQMVEIEKNFGVLLSQLPEDTEVPGLLDDISNVGVGNGLVLDFIGLDPEQRKEFYVELPIKVKASGNYHDFGAFVSGVAALPRIVTLHDFSIKSEKSKGRQDSTLKMEILAKTYRYKDD